MANTTWNPTDKTTTTLTNSNLTATLNGSTGAGVRSTDRWVAGKYYWECTVSAWGIGSTSVGIATAATVLNFNGGSAPNSYLGQVSLSKNGQVQFGFNVFVAALGTRASGDTIGIALDLDLRLIWFRVAPAGNWNGSATANPATGAGGFSIAGQTANNLDAVYALAASQGGDDVVTANFGDTAFSGTVPAGFTSGFPASTPPALVAANTQMLVEEWGAPDPAAQLTQLLLEEWAVVPPYGDMRATQVGAEQWANVIPPQMQATQAAIEQWTSTANVTTRMLATQAAIEQWSPVTSAVTAATRQAALTVVT